MALVRVAVELGSQRGWVQPQKRPRVAVEDGRVQGEGLRLGERGTGDEDARAGRDLQAPITDQIGEAAGIDAHGACRSGKCSSACWRSDSRRKSRSAREAIR